MASYCLIPHDLDTHCDWTNWSPYISSAPIVTPQNTFCWADDCKTRISVKDARLSCKLCGIPKYCSEPCAEAHSTEHDKWCAVALKSKKPTTHTIVIICEGSSPLLEIANFRDAFKLCLEVLLLNAFSPSVNLHPDHAFVFMRSQFESTGWNHKAIRRVFNPDCEYDSKGMKFDTLSVNDMKIMLNCGLNIDILTYAVAFHGKESAIAVAMDYCSKPYRANVCNADMFVKFRSMLTYEQRHQYANKYLIPEPTRTRSIIFDGLQTSDRDLIVKRQNVHFLLQFLPSAKPLVNKPLFKRQLIPLLLRYAKPSQ